MKTDFLKEETKPFKRIKIGHTACTKFRLESDLISDPLISWQRKPEDPHWFSVQRLILMRS